MIRLITLFSLLIMTGTGALAGTIGTASYYGKRFHGKLTASGERFNMHAMTAAHKTLPFGTRIRVTNIENNKSVVLRVNDRGPFHGNRILDLSRGANTRLDCHLCKVRIQVLEVGDGKYRRSR